MWDAKDPEDKYLDMSINSNKFVICKMYTGLQNEQIQLKTFVHVYLEVELSRQSQL